MKIELKKTGNLGKEMLEPNTRRDTINGPVEEKQNHIKESNAKNEQILLTCSCNCLLT